MHNVNVIQMEDQLHLKLAWLWLITWLYM